MLDEDGTPQAIDLQAFVADIAAAPAVIAFAPWSLAGAGPHGRRHRDRRRRRLRRRAPTDVPEPLRQAIRLLVAHWYENRGLIAVGQSVAVLPATVAALLAPYRVLSL